MRKREMILPLALAALLPALTWLDRPNWGAHAAGFTAILFPALGALALIMAAAGGFQRRWLRALVWTALLASCLISPMILGEIPPCPECG